MVKEYGQNMCDSFNIWDTHALSPAGSRDSFKSPQIFLNSHKDLVDITSFFFSEEIEFLLKSSQCFMKASSQCNFLDQINVCKIKK